MKLTNLWIKNYRSISDSGNLRIEPLAIIIGQGIAAESDILEAINTFFAQGASLISDSDFYEKSQPICLCATFAYLNKHERIALKRYLINDSLYLEKIFKLVPVSNTINYEYQGYLPEPQNWWLSLTKIYQRYNERQIPWEKIAYQNKIVEFVREYNTVTEKSYLAGLEKLIFNNPDIEFDSPEIDGLKSLGQNPDLLNLIPDFIFIPDSFDNNSQENKTDHTQNYEYAVEYFLNRIIQSQQVFFLKDPRILKSVSFIDTAEGHEDKQKKQAREFYLNIIEELSVILSNKVAEALLLPFTVKILPRTEQTLEKLQTNVEHGIYFKNALIYSLLEILVYVKAGQYLENRPKKRLGEKSFILAINRLEFLVCTQVGKKFFSLLSQIADFEQTIFLTNSSNFVDISQYESIILIQKDTSSTSFKFQQALPDTLTGFERESFNLNLELTGIDSTLFFAKKIVLIEDRKYSAALLQAAKNIGLFKLYPEEIGYSLLNTGSKAQMIIFIKLLNAFALRCIILIESEEPQILTDLLKENKVIKINGNFQELLGMSANINQLDDFMKFLLSSIHPSAGFRKILNDLFDISNQQKEVSNG